MTTSNETTDVAEFFKQAQRGASMLAKGSEDMEVGRGTMAASTVLICAADTDYRETIIARAYAAITARTDENKTEVDAGKAYFRDMFDASKDKQAFERATQEDEPERISRDRQNNKVNSINSAIAFVCHVLIAFDHVKGWSHVSASKQKGSLKLSTVGAAAFWPEKSKTLEEMDEKTVTVSNKAGGWRMSHFEGIGQTVAASKGLRKAAKTKATPLKDAALTLANSVEANDAKVLANPETRLQAFSTLVSLIDMLNDSTVADHLDSAQVKAFREHVVLKLDATQKALTASQTKLIGKAA